jgi:very-short-patch-repair endonuclease
MAKRKTVDRIRGTPREVDEAAKRLRRDSTAAEIALWKSLRAKRLAGLKFRRQQPMGPFVLDFLCAEHKLVVEIDGEGHSEPDQSIRDDARTAQLNSFGYRVLRFPNELVLNDLAIVLQAILEATVQPLPQNWGRGWGEGPALE